MRNTSSRRKPMGIIKGIYKADIQILVNIQAQEPPSHLLPSNHFTPSTPSIHKRRLYSLHSNPRLDKIMDTRYNNRCITSHHMESSNLYIME